MASFWLVTRECEFMDTYVGVRMMIDAVGLFATEEEAELHKNTLKRSKGEVITITEVQVGSNNVNIFNTVTSSYWNN